MKILITGAHFTPAVAVIEELKKVKGVEVVYVGRQTTFEGDKSSSVESEVIPQLGVKFLPIVTGRLQRTLTFYTIPSLLKIPIGVLQALYIILSEKPDVILSFGGYVALPIVVAGWLFSIPIIIHEQTLVGGLANKISSYFADKIAVSFEKSAFRGEKVVLTGNPIRSEIVSLDDKLVHPFGGRNRPTVLLIGGNQGSHVINLAVEECLSKLLKIADIYHQIGDSKYRDFERLIKVRNDSYHVFKFINEDWAKILAGCNLVVSRAGVNSLTELAYLGKPTLIIPIPNSEQRTNAKYFADLGLAKILSQSQLSGQTLFSNIKLCLKNLKLLSQKAKRAKERIVPFGAKRLALETILLAK